MDQYGPYRYVVTRDEAVEAGRIFMKRKLFTGMTRWVLIAIVILSIMSVALAIYLGGMKPTSLLALALAPMVVFGSIYWAGPAHMKRQFAQSAALRDEQALSFDATSLRLESSRGHAVLPYKELHGFTEGDSLVLIYQTEAFFNPVPKPALGEGLPVFLDLLEKHSVRR